MPLETQQKRNLGGVLSILLLNQLVGATAPAALAHGGPGHTPFSSTPTYSPEGWSAAGAVNSMPAAFGYGPASLPAPTQNLPMASQSLPLPQANASQFASHFHNVPVNVPTQNLKLDLSSADNSVLLNAAAIRNGAVTIDVGGTATTYNVGDRVTAAELVAIGQAQVRGGQSIQLDDQGRATGGTFSLTRMTSAVGFNVSSVVVPANVTAVDRIGNHSNITLSGDLINNGSIIEVAGKHGMGGSSITAQDIYNGQGALITTNSGTGVADLNLSAVQDFTNHGTISSSGNLTITAGGNLTNSQVLSANGTVGLQSTNITNSGIVTSQTGNVNLAAPGDQSLAMNINNTGGIISATNGAINVRDAAYAGGGNTNLIGGDLLSKELNLNSGGGTINVDVKELTGTVTSNGEAVHVHASTDNLVLGKQCLVGDPTYYNDAGDISLTGDIVVGEDLVIIARGDVVAQNTINKISAGTLVGGNNITIVAGVNVTGTAGDPTGQIDGTPPITGNTTGSVSFTGVYNDGTNDIGGNIMLSKAGTNLTIDAGSASGKAGNIILAAYAGKDNGGLFTNGTVTMSLFTNITALGSSTANDGDVTILAGGRSGSFIGSINAGNIVFSGTQPTLANPANPIIYDKLGNITNGNSIVRDYAAAPTAQGFVQLAHDVKASKNINISGLWIDLAGGSLTTSSGSITVAATGATTQARVQIEGNIQTTSGGNINIISSGGVDSNFSAAVTTDSSKTNAGNITIIGGAAFTETPTQIAVTGKSGLNGDINFVTKSGSLGQLSANTTTPNTFGGDITLVSYNGLVVLPTATTITTASNGTGANGNVTIVADNGKGSDAIGTAANPISIATFGGLKGTGYITLSVSTPNLATINSFGYVNPRDFLSLQFQQGSITYNKLVTNASLITIGQGSYDFTGTLPTTSDIMIKSDNITVSGTLSGGRSLALLATGNIDIRANITTVNGGLLLVAGGNIATSVDGLSIATAVTSIPSGNISMAAGANFEENFGYVYINGPSLSGGQIDLANHPLSALSTKTSDFGISSGSMNFVAFSNTNQGRVLLPTALMVDTSSFDGAAGAFRVVAGATSGTAIEVGTINTTNQTTGTSGAIVLQAATPNASPSSLLGFDNTGKISQGDPVNAKTAAFTAGEIHAASLLSRTGTIDISSAGNLKIGLVSVSANASNGNAGTITVQNASTTDDLYIGDTSKANYIDQVLASAFIVGFGGNISISQTGGKALTIATAASLNFDNAGDKKGGSLTLFSNDLINLGSFNTINANASNASLAGNISITAKDVTFDGTTLTLKADSPSFAGGSVSLTLTGTKTHSIGQTGDFYLSAKGGGGDLNYTAASSALILDGNGVDITSSAATPVSGGSITITALGISNPTKTIVLNVDGNDATSGGAIFLTDLEATNITIGGAVGNFQFSAQGGKTSGNGGQIAVSTAGNMTVDPSFLLLQPKSGTGNGGALSLTALGNLLVNGSLNVDGLGGGTAGNISLSSNSSVPFVISGSKISNGVTGTLSALGAASKFSALPGTISITNEGGGITNSLAFSSYLSLREEANGPVLVTSSLGGPAVSNIVLISGKGAALLITKGFVQADTVAVASDTGAITISKLMANNVAFETTDTKTGVVAITSISSTPLNIASGKAGKITVLTPGDLTTSGPLTGGAVTLTSTAKTAATMTINGLINSTGFVTLAAPNDININANITGNLGIKVTTKDLDGSIFAANVAQISANASSTITMTANESIVMGTGNTFEGAKAVILSAPKGSIGIGGAGAVTEPLSITATARDAIGVNGPIKVTNSVTLKTTDTINLGGNINVSNNILLSSSKSTLSITAPATGKVVDDFAASGVTIKAGTVTIAGPAGIQLSKASITADTKSLTMTASKGSIIFDTAKATAANISLTALNGITLGLMNAGTNISVKTTNTKAPTDIIIHGSITAGATGSITLSAASGSAISDTGSTTKTLTAGAITLIGPAGVDLSSGGTNLISTAKGITVTSAKGTIQSSVSGKMDAATTIGLTALDFIDIEGTLKAGTGITITSTDKVVGDVVLNNTVSTTGPGAKVTITANGADGFAQNGGTLTAVGALTIKAANAKILNNGTLESTSGAVSLTAVDYNGTSGFLKSGLSTTITGTGKTAANFVKVGQTDTVNGSITIKGAGGSVSVAAGKSVNAVSTATKTKAFIIINASTVSKTFATTIAIDGNISTTVPTGGSGNVTIAIGAVPASGKNPITTGDIANVAVNSPTNTVFGGTNLKAIQGPATAALLRTIGNGNVIFNSANTTNTITIGDTVTILSDPPETASASAMLPAFSSAAVVIPSARISAAAISQSTLTSVSMPTAAPTITPQTISPLLGSVSVYQMDNRALGFGATGRSSLNLNWISETELAGGKIPARLHQIAGSTTLDGGSLLVAPDADSVISTPHGDVSIKAKSLVLVMTFTDGMAVYNLHDNCKNAVQLTAGGKTINLSPGKSAVVARDHIKQFEHINPAQLVGYGPMSEAALDSGLKMYHGEFSLPSAINAVPTLRNLLSSGDARNKKIANDFLKTTSIVLQLRNNAVNYKQMLKPQLTAYNR